MSEKEAIHIILPPGALGISDDDNSLDTAMRMIALALDPEDNNWVSKYGESFENDVFMMHRYCWCEREDCAWCSGNAPNFLHKASGFSVIWYKYIGRDMHSNKKIGGKKMMSIVKECLSSIKD